MVGIILKGSAQYAYLRSSLAVQMNRYDSQICSSLAQKFKNMLDSVRLEGKGSNPGYILITVRLKPRITQVFLILHTALNKVFLWKVSRRSMGPNSCCRPMEIRNGIMLTNIMVFATVSCRQRLVIATGTLVVFTWNQGVLWDNVFPFSALRSRPNILFYEQRSLCFMGRFGNRCPSTIRTMYLSLGLNNTFYFLRQSCIAHQEPSEHFLLAPVCGHQGSLVGCNNFRNSGLKEDCCMGILILCCVQIVNYPVKLSEFRK